MNKDICCQRWYKLHLKNFGPIQDGELIIKPITVLIGKNNTGKSYTTMLFYSLMKGLATLTEHFLLKNTFLEKDTKIDEYIKRFINKNKIKIRKINSIEQLKNLISSFLDFISTDDLISLLDERGKDIIANSIRRTFSTELEELVKESQETCEVSLLTYNGLKLEIMFSKKRKLEIKLSIADKKLFIDNIPLKMESPYLSTRKDLKFLILNGLLISNDIYYLPAARSGIIQAYKAILSALISVAPSIALRDFQYSPELSGPVSDFLNNILSILASYHPRIRVTSRSIYYRRWVESGRILDYSDRESIKSIIDFMNNQILKGRIKILRMKRKVSEIRYESYLGKVELPLARSSSMISEVAPIVLYLQYLVRPGDYVIIEEPESHLHPGIQGSFARVIARLWNLAKINIIITTHSDFLFSELNNLIKLSGLSNDKVKKLGYSKKDVIQYDNIGVYLIEYRKKGSIFKTLEVSEDGVSEDEFSEIAKELYEKTLAIEFSKEIEEK